jgi:membrane associated rhomboid family serine protease
VYFVQATLVGDDNMALLLGYAPGDLASRSLWTVGTYMFVHGGLLHLLLNMWTLWLFGPRVERAWGASTFTWYYLWCGLGGWAFHYMFQPNGGILVGASAAILGVAVAYASRWPDDEVLFFGVVPMKVKWLVAFMALINITMTVLDSGSTGGTAYAAHFGGMVAGWLYLRAPNVGSLDRLRSRIAPAPDYGDEPPRAVPKSGRPRERERETDDIVAQSKAAIARVRPSPKPQPQPATVATVAPAPSTALDAVLDKIAAEGIESLTQAERMMLDEWSKRLRELT